MAALGDATITGVTLRGGKVASGSPRNNTGGIGGAVWVQRGNGSGTVTFIDSAITDSTASNTGGGVLVQKTVLDDGEDDLVLIRTEVLRNRVTDETLGQGGGITSQEANVRIVDSTIDGNIASTSGGGILSIESQSQLDARLVISGSTISNNIAGLTGTGGAAFLGRNVSSDNSIYNLKPAELGDHVGVSTSGLAADLADNGGETLTLSIPEDSPVVGEGLAIHCPATDQRGVDRPLPCAVGAFEPAVAAPLTFGEASEVPADLGADVTAPRSISASEALIVLSASVGTAECPLCVCDVNASVGITATDALLLIRYAVGQPVTLECPPCT